MDHCRQLVGRGCAQLTSIGRSRGGLGAARMFGAACFALAPDGRALFVPAPGHVADDLWPLAGVWTPDGDGVELDLRRVVSEYRRAALTGRMQCSGGEGGFTGRYELTVGDEVHTHTVVVELDGRSAAVAESGIREIGGVPLPIQMAGTLSGSCGGVQFGPSDFTLSLLDPVAGAAQPVELLLASTDHTSAGGLLWLTGARGLTEEHTGQFEVTARDGCIAASVAADTDAAIGITFNAPSHAPLQIPGLGALFLPVAARRARLELRITRTGTTVRADGAINLSGIRPAGPVELNATLAAHGSLPAETDLDGPGFEQLWAAGAPWSPPPRRTAIRSWRDARDEGFALARNQRHREAVPLLTEALAGCRAEQAATNSSEQARTSALITESSILGALIPCHGPGTDLDVLLELLVQGVGVHQRLSGIEHLTGVVRHDAHASMVTLSDALERRRSSLHTEVERIELLTSSADFFGRLVGMLLELGQSEASLVASERARARALADLLIGRDPDGLLLTTEALTKDKIRGAVASYGATVVEYWLDDTAGHAWVVHPDGRIAHVALALGDSQLAELAGSLRERPELDPGVLAELYRLLIAPLPAELLPSAGAPLAIVPHRLLNVIPFAALTDPDGAPLIQHWPLVMLPSIGTIVAAGVGGPGKPVSAMPWMLAIVDPTMPKLPDPLSPLPRLRAALPALTRLFPAPGGTVHTGAEATLAALARDVVGADLLLLGTHGHADDSDPASSYLALAPDRDRHSGLARISELAQLRLNTRLAVLLACSTAAGPITGDGVLGISRAFLLGGVRSLVCPLRPVGDSASVQLGYLMLSAWARDGVSPAEALRLAQLTMRTHYGGQPHLWADFMLTGAWR